MKGLDDLLGPKPLERAPLAPEQEEVPQPERGRDAVCLPAPQDTDAGEDREAAERRVKERRRTILQRVKDRTIHGWSSPTHTLPPEAIAQALKAVEAELSQLPIEELPESEVTIIAEGVRDGIYQPLLQAQDRARTEARQQEERQRQKETRQRQDSERRARLIEAGVAHATRELGQERDLDWLTRWNIRQAVQRTLVRELTASHSEAEVAERVDRILDRELRAHDNACAAKERTQARPGLIAHGAAYAARELDREDDLDPWQRRQLTHAVRERLARELAGDESPDEVEDLVKELIDDELAEGEDDAGEELGDGDVDDELDDDDDGADELDDEADDDGDDDGGNDAYDDYDDDEDAYDDEE